MSENPQGPAASVRPGEIWLIEQLATADLSPLDRRAIEDADVILYDRTIEPLVAAILPLGGYAEPLPAGEPDREPAISPRALHFAGDGWRPGPAGATGYTAPPRPWRQHGVLANCRSSSSPKRPPSRSSAATLASAICRPSSRNSPPTIR
jgi:hypothetical protein